MVIKPEHAHNLSLAKNFLERLLSNKTDFQFRKVLKHVDKLKYTKYIRSSKIVNIFVDDYMLCIKFIKKDSRQTEILTLNLLEFYYAGNRFTIEEIIQLEPYSGSKQQPFQIIQEKNIYKNEFPDAIKLWLEIK